MMIQDISQRTKVWFTLLILTSVQLKNSSFASFVHRFNLYSPAKWNASCFNKKRTPLARGRRGEEKTRANCCGLLGGRTWFFFVFFKETRVSAFIHFAAIMFFCHPPDEMSPTNDSIFRAFRTPLQLLKVESSNFPLKKKKNSFYFLFSPRLELFDSVALFLFQVCSMSWEKHFPFAKTL